MPGVNSPNMRIYQDEIEGLSQQLHVSNEKIKKSLRKHIFPAVKVVAGGSKTQSIRGKDVARFLKKVSKNYGTSYSYGQFGGNDHDPASNINFCGGKDLVTQCLDSFSSSCQAGGATPIDLLTNPRFCDGNPSQCIDAAGDTCMSLKKKSKSKKSYAFHNMIRRAQRQLEQDGQIEKKRLTHQAGGALTNYLLFKLAEDFH